MNANIELHRIPFNENFSDSFKRNLERFLAYVEKLYTNYCAFTVKRPYLGLFFAIFIVFSAFPLLSYIVFSIISTTLILGSSLCLGLLTLAFLLGLAGLTLSIALICSFFLTCVVCFWIALTFTTTRFIDGYIKKNNFGIFLSNYVANGTNGVNGVSNVNGVNGVSNVNGVNGVNGDVGPSESQSK
ncbi:23538_t:CDS:2 [Cetraspora pellucida]|uniref:23538_t:CDS:1 n=1 Tax=Cetraspora pellucida TaxID=1433469 RepID=A0A9N9GCV4_9GLOM|nr:23538_t:CDS:2 [Cetraspora pellucida]